MDIEGSLDSLERGSVVLLGIPFDEHSSFISGAALAPPRIREALYSDETNLSTESGDDLSRQPRLRDLGDLRLERGAAALAQIEHTVAALLERGARVLSLGGDHALTLPVVRAYARRYELLNILHLDAHPDLYDEFEGDRYSHACPFARIMEEGLASRLLQVGIRTMNPHQQAQARRLGVEVVDMRQWGPGIRLRFEGPLYISLDLDVLDPAFAPGVSHHEPGGLSTRELIRLIQGLETALVGADIVEFNPERDVVGVTAMVAAKMVKELAANMLHSG
ncbi:MAG: agmatinase [Anaerolineae bacterium]|nr:agmatinase [Anaerolineae bacterium]